MAVSKINERMAVMEQKVTNIDNKLDLHIKLQREDFDKVFEKLDRFAETKVDKTDYQRFQGKVNAFVGSLVLILIGILGFLIKYTLYD